MALVHRTIISLIEIKFYVIKFLEYIWRLIIAGNNSEAGIWYHRPYKAKALVITHNLPEVQATCTVKPPFLNYHLQVSKPSSPIFPDILRYLFIISCNFQIILVKYCLTLSLFDLYWISVQIMTVFLCKIQTAIRVNWLLKTSKSKTKVNGW